MTMIVGTASPVYPRPEPQPAAPEPQAPAVAAAPTGAAKARAMPAILTVSDTTAQLIAQQTPAAQPEATEAPAAEPDILVVPAEPRASTAPTSERSYRRAAALSRPIAAARTYGFRDAATLLAIRPQGTAAKASPTGLSQAIAASLGS